MTWSQAIPVANHGKKSNRSKGSNYKEMLFPGLMPAVHWICFYITQNHITGDSIAGVYDSVHDPITGAWIIFRKFKHQVYIIM